MTHSTQKQTKTGWQKVRLVLFVLLALANIPSMLISFVGIMSSLTSLEFDQMIKYGFVMAKSIVMIFFFYLILLAPLGMSKASKTSG